VFIAQLAQSVCRSLHRERGLKRGDKLTLDIDACRSLHRERGLKHPQIGSLAYGQKVAPFTGSVD